MTEREDVGPISEAGPSDPNRMRLQKLSINIARAGWDVMFTCLDNGLVGLRVFFNGRGKTGAMSAEVLGEYLKIGGPDERRTLGGSSVSASGSSLQFGFIGRIDSDFEEVVSNIVGLRYPINPDQT